MRLPHTAGGMMRQISQRFQSSKVFHGKGTPTIGIRYDRLEFYCYPATKIGEI